MEPRSRMLRQVIEDIERLHAANPVRRDDPQSTQVEETLAQCLQELRAIVALEARDQLEQKPMLRIV
jgi:hypothetical protein